MFLREQRLSHHHRVCNFKVKVVRNDDDTANIYQINGVNQPTFHLLKEAYYFDLSDSSLYSATSGNNHILRLSTTPNGTHGSAEYTTGVTKSASYIDAEQQVRFYN